MPNTSFSILDLPEEVLARVFANLTEKQDKSNWVATCRFFNRISQDKTLFTPPELYSQRNLAILHSHFPAYISMFPQIQMQYQKIKNSNPKKESNKHQDYDTQVKNFLYNVTDSDSLLLPNSIVNTLNLNTLYLFLVSAYTVLTAPEKEQNQQYSPANVASKILDFHNRSFIKPFHSMLREYLKDFKNSVIKKIPKKEMIILEYYRRWAGVASCLYAICHVEKEFAVVHATIKQAIKDNPSCLETFSKCTDVSNTVFDFIHKDGILANFNTHYSKNLIDRVSLIAAMLAGLDLNQPLFLLNFSERNGDITQKLVFQSAIAHLLPDEQESFKKAMDAMNISEKQAPSPS